MASAVEIVGSGWRNDLTGAQPHHQSTIDTIYGWLEPELWTPVEYRPPTADVPVFSVDFFNPNPNGHFERSGFLGRRERFFIDLHSAIRPESGMRITNRIGDGHSVEQVTLTPLRAVGPYQIDMAHQDTNRIGIDRIILRLIQDPRSAGFDRHKVRVDLELFDAFDRVVTEIGNLERIRGNILETIEHRYNYDTARVSQEDAQIRASLSDKLALKAKYKGMEALY